jgi:peptide/nickel transport system substrate-binding protein
MKSFYEANHAFTLTERIFFYVFVLIAIISGLTLLSRLNNRFLMTVPDYGGSFTEGIVGVPRFINPILALSDPDQDLVSLVFSGLLKATPEGTIIDDLSQEHTISDDGKTYSFTLREDAQFHDGKPVTTDDIAFTIERIQDPTVKSPKRTIWEGVVVKKIDSRRITFTLKQAYAPFIENFTLGILPRHIWKDIPSDQFSFSERNVEAVGSGPYAIKKVSRNSYGLPTFYNLRAFSDYSLGKPFVKDITLNFYQDEAGLLEAYEAGDIESMSGISPENIKSIGDNTESQTVTATLPRVFGVFFNQNQASVFLNKEVRQALSVAIDRERIIASVLGGYGVVDESPLPASSTGGASATSTTSSATTTATAGSIQITRNGSIARTDQALAILSKGGWVLNPKTGIMEKKSATGTIPLSFSISTSDAPELKQAAELIKEDWEKIGASVDLKVFEIGDLHQNVIRPRKFDALFFGEIIGRELDLYPFWHSSQRNDPGLNIALYANISADKILESIRLTQDRSERLKKVADFEAILRNDVPAAFVYSPDFIYVLPKALGGVKLGELSNPSERFLNVYEWHIEKNKVWKLFTN